jgi:hypothetical protein
MAVVTIEADALTVKFRGIHRFWTLRRRLDVPLGHIVDARIDPLLASGRPGWRLLGAELPGIVAAGRFISHGERAFWDVVNPDKALVIELREERYARLVLEVDEPETVVDTVRRALRERGFPDERRTTPPCCIAHRRVTRPRAQAANKVLSAAHRRGRT